MTEIQKKSSKKEVIRVGLIGHQFMGIAHSYAFRNAGMWYNLPVEIEMKALCAKDSLENLESFAKQYGWQSIETDWEKLIQRNDIDLISVATPGFLHKPMVLAAAQAGKHVLCEKPLANNLSDAVEMLESVEKAGVRHCCGYSYRSTPAQALAAQMVEEGRIGKIYHVHVRYAQDWCLDPDIAMVWRFNKKLAGSGALGDICAHSTDAARFITGLEISRVVANTATMIKERPVDTENPGGEKEQVTVDDVAQYLCEFDNGATGCFEATRLAGGRHNHNSIEINGDKGSLYWNFAEQNYLYYYDHTRSVAERGFTKIHATHDSHPYGGGPWPQGHPISYADTFMIEVANFVRAIAEDKPFHPDFNDGVQVQKVLEAIEQSVADGVWVTIE